MKKIKTLDDLKAIREKNRAAVEPAEGATIIRVGVATCGVAAGSRAVMAAIEDELAKNKVGHTTVVGVGCLGFCYAEPLVEVESAGFEPIRYGYVDEARAREIVRQHILRGELLDNAIIEREVRRA